MEDNTEEILKLDFIVHTTLFGYLFLFYLGILVQWFPNFSARDPQNNDNIDWGLPLTLEVAHNVMHSHVHIL